MKSINQANVQLPSGALQNQAVEVHAKIEKLPEDKREKFGGLNEKDLEEARRLMGGNINAKATSLSKKSSLKAI